MKKNIALLAFALAAAAALPREASAQQDRGLGLGLRLGAPTAFDMKVWLNSRHALNLALGWVGDYWGNRWAFADGACYDRGFYDRNRDYCNRLRRDYWDRYDRYGYDNFHIHGDYLIHNFNLIRAAFPIPLYYGPGIQYEYIRDYDPDIAIRGTIGLGFLPRGIPFDFFVEISPLIRILPAPGPGPYSRFTIYGGAGARFWF